MEELFKDPLEVILLRRSRERVYESGIDILDFQKFSNFIFLKKISKEDMEMLYKIKNDRTFDTVLTLIVMRYSLNTFSGKREICHKFYNSIRWTEAYFNANKLKKYIE